MAGRRPSNPGRSLGESLSRPADERLGGFPAQGLLVLLWALAALLAPLSFPALLAAREDSASLVFQKTADIGDTHVYVVKRGDSIDRIFRSQAGDEPVPYAEIRQLNPEIKDLNRIFPGQRIVLPLRGTSAADLRPVPGAPAEKEPPPVLYPIQEGDSLSRILLSLGVQPADVLPAYRLLRRLNPEIEDLNRLPAGQVLKLPGHLVSAAPTAAVQSALAPAPPVISDGKPDETPVTAAQTPDQPLSRPAERSPGPALPDTAQIPPSSTSMILLETIRPVIARMGGLLSIRGNHVIPLKGSDQFVIDCALVPVVELDDGSVILMDFSGRISQQNREQIRSSWPRYAFVPPEELADPVSALQGIVGRSRDYRMTRSDGPVALDRQPEVSLFPDWIISGAEGSGSGATRRQAIHVLRYDESPMTEVVRTYLDGRGIPVTEIGTGRMPPPPPAPGGLIDLRGLQGIRLAERLLLTVGERPQSGVESVVFDQAHDGFNLSITADLTVERGPVRILIHTRPLPEQFGRVLRERRTEWVPIGETESGRPLIESVLRGVGLPVSFGHFSFRIPDDGGRPRVTITLAALKTVSASGALYLIDFDPAPEVLTLLQRRLGQNFAKY
jgi:LysM repeat protein